MSSNYDWILRLQHGTSVTWLLCFLIKNKISFKSEIQSNDAHNNTLCYTHEALNNSRICVGIINV